MIGSEPEFREGSGEPLPDVAARWVVRQDRRLSEQEADELETWLRADPRHRLAHERAAASWRMFRELGRVVRHAPEVAPSPTPRWLWPAAGTLAAAAAMALLFLAPGREPPGRPTDDAAVTTAAGSTRTHVLPDGSVARLNDGARLVEAYTAGERRVRLVRGEAFFTVTGDAARPFLVQVDDLRIRAVGTAFAVLFDPDRVDVLVTEGSVEVLPTEPERPGERSVATPATPPLVTAGQRATVMRRADRQAAPVVVTPVSPDEMARRLAWSDGMLELAGATLGDLVSTFSQRSGRRIEIAGPALAAVRIGGRFPLDDVDGFVRAMEEIYELKATRREDGTIVLSAR